MRWRTSATAKRPVGGWEEEVQEEEDLLFFFFRGAVLTVFGDGRYSGGWWRDVDLVRGTSSPRLPAALPPGVM